MKKILFDFSGKMIDRSYFDLSFNGIELKVTIEDQNEPHRKLLITYSTVLHYEFLGLDLVMDYPNVPHLT
jgi:hypothetical protein